MYRTSDYIARGCTFLNNQIRPRHKKLASLMIYATDRCDSACKHCLIWAKRPTVVLPKDEIVKLVSSECVTKHTKIGLEGGEFLLHPEALEILEWFALKHPNFDLLSNGLQPDKLVHAVKLFLPQRLWISLDGDPETYRHMRGKDGYGKVLQVIDRLQGTVPISIMFTLSPFNDFDDLKHVAAVAKEYGVDLRIGIYNNIDFFDTIHKAHNNEIGTEKNTAPLTFKNISNDTFKSDDSLPEIPAPVSFDEWKARVPNVLKEFDENYDFVLLYNLWQQQQLRLRCFSIFDNLIVLPNGDVPICQNLPTKLGNIYTSSLDDVVNSETSIQQQEFHSKHCNRCWINYHRKQDVVLYRNMEKFFGSKATSKLLGFYQWDAQQRSYKEIVG